MNWHFQFAMRLIIILKVSQSLNYIAFTAEDNFNSARHLQMRHSLKLQVHYSDYWGDLSSPATARERQGTVRVVEG